MDLNLLFEAQAKLDAHIVEEKGLEGVDTFERKKVALLCELYEMANEFKFFKYWSNKKANRDAGLEEFSDVLHFLISISNDIGYTSHTYTEQNAQDLNRLTLGITNLAAVINKRDKKIIGMLFNLIINLGYQLGFTEQEVINAYHEKNKKNHVRQETSY